MSTFIIVLFVQPFFFIFVTCIVFVLIVYGDVVISPIRRILNNYSQHPQKHTLRGQQIGLQKKGPDYYIGLKEQYEKFVKGNQLLPLFLLLEAANTKKISLLTKDIKIRRLIGVNAETMEEALKCLNIGAKVLPRKSNAM